MELWAIMGLLIVVAALCGKPDSDPALSEESDMYDEEKERLRREVEELKVRVRRNPWPWLAGGLAIGFALGAFFM